MGAPVVFKVQLDELFFILLRIKMSVGFAAKAEDKFSFIFSAAQTSDGNRIESDRRPGAG
jgi:hypothetical protein